MTSVCADGFNPELELKVDCERIFSGRYCRKHWRWGNNPKKRTEQPRRVDTFRTERRKSAKRDLRLGFERRTHGEESSRNVITISSSDGSKGSFSIFSVCFFSCPVFGLKPFAFALILLFFPGSIQVLFFLSIAVWWTDWLRVTLFQLRDYGDLHAINVLFPLRLGGVYSDVYLFLLTTTPSGVSRSHFDHGVEKVCSTASGTTAFPRRNPLPPALVLPWYDHYESRAYPALQVDLLVTRSAVPFSLSKPAFLSFTYPRALLQWG